MKTLFLFPILLLALIACGCSKEDGANCNFSIQVQPNSNPANYEILISSPNNDLTADVEVFFDKVKSTVKITDNKEIITKVPATVSGLTTLSLVSGSCTATTPFEVLGAWPGNTPLSPPTIIIPRPPTAFPASFQNFWINSEDDQHGFNLQPDPDDPKKISEQDVASFENHFVNEYFSFNPLSGTIDTDKNSISITVTRKDGKETYTGMFIDPSPWPKATYAILLTSMKTGRQLVLYPS